MNNVKEHLEKVSVQKRHLELGAHHTIPGMVSVCMPNYNKENYVFAAIESIAIQTNKNIELIIVDDHSSDNSDEVIKKAVLNFCKDIPVTYIRSPRRMGTAWAQNWAYYLARGEYIANMDSDDISHPERFETQLKFLTKEGYDLTGTNFSIFRDNLSNIALKDGGIWLKYRPDEIAESYLFKDTHCVCFGTIMFKQEVLERTGGMDKQYIGTEDYAFVDKVVMAGYKVGNTRKILYYYRENPTQRSKLFHQSQV